MHVASLIASGRYLYNSVRRNDFLQRRYIVTDFAQRLYNKRTFEHAWMRQSEVLTRENLLIIQTSIT